MKIGDKVKIIPSKMDKKHLWWRDLVDKVMTVKKICDFDDYVRIRENDYIYKEKVVKEIIYDDYLCKKESLEIIHDDFINEEEFSL